MTKDGITMPSQPGRRMCVCVSELTAENGVEVGFGICECLLSLINLTNISVDCKIFSVQIRQQ